MKITWYTKIIVLFMVVGMGFYYYQIANAEERPVTAVYVEAWRNPEDVKLSEKKVDIALIAFAKLDGTDIVFDKDKNVDAEIRANIKRMKELNKDTKFVLAVGGYGVDGFSDAALDGNRYVFTENIMSTVKELDLDGVDIDWEYPAHDAWGTQKSRPEDTKNFTSLMKELREKLNMLPHQERGYLLTFAAGAQEWYFDLVELDKLMKYVDYINVMAYDLTGKWSPVTGYNANLYIDKYNHAEHSVEQVMQGFISRNVDSKKILLGIPSYSYGWKQVKIKDGKPFVSGKPIEIDKVDLSYKAIQEKYLNKNGYKRFFDDKAKAAYLYNGDTFISYEDEEALEAKVQYIRNHQLGGVMVWEYHRDADDGIINYLAEQLNKDQDE